MNALFRGDFPVIQTWEMPEYGALDEGPVGMWFRVPCPGHGVNPHCAGWAQAYRLQRRGERSSGLESIPDVGHGAIRSGATTIDHVGRCKHCVGFAIGGGQEMTVAALKAQEEADRRGKFERLLEASGIPPRYQGLSLWSRCFRTHEAPVVVGPGKTYVVGPVAEAVVKWARADEHKGSAVLLGTVGGGKTHLAMAHACDRIERLKPVLVLQERSVQAHLQASMQSEEYRVARQLLEYAAQVSWLLWDDLAYSPEGAKDRLPDRLLRELDFLLNARYEALLPTVCTSNCDWPTLERRVGTAFVSRLRQMVGANVFEFTGPDWRSRPPKK